MTNHAAQLAIIKHVTRQESRSSAGNCQADEPAGITQLRWQLSCRWAARNQAAQQALITWLCRHWSSGWSSTDHVTEHARWMVLWRPTRPFRTNTQKRCPFHYRGLDAKVGSQATSGVTGKFGFGVKNEAGQRLTEFCQENVLVIANTLFWQHKRRRYTWTSPDGQYQNQIDSSLQLKMEKLYIVSKNKTWNWLWLRL